MTMPEKLDPAASVSRNMTPAFAHGSVFVWLTTRAVIVPLPVNVCESYWKESAVPQMSTPEPFTVYVPPLLDDEPGAVTPPMSPPLSGDGVWVVTERAAVDAETLAGVAASKAATW
jgi:hypothetical protein